MAKFNQQLKELREIEEDLGVNYHDVKYIPINKRTAEEIEGYRIYNHARKIVTYILVGGHLYPQQIADLIAYLQKSRRKLLTI